MHPGRLTRSRMDLRPYLFKPTNRRLHPTRRSASARRIRDLRSSATPRSWSNPQHLERHATAEGFSEFELVAEDINPDEAALAAPEVRRGLRELAEFQKDQRPYS